MEEIRPRQGRLKPLVKRLNALYHERKNMIVVETQFDQVLTYRNMPKIVTKGKAITLSLPDMPIKSIIVQTGNDILDTLDKYVDLKDFLESHVSWFNDSDLHKISLKGGEICAKNRE